MKRAVTNEQMKVCDKNEINKGTSSLSLMENAARAITEEFLKIYKGGSVAVICGGGNNGGDGAATARLLYEKGIKCSVYIYYTKLTADCENNLIKLRNLPLKIFENPPTYNYSGYDYIIDALLGTGINKEITGIYKDVIGGINSSGAEVLSADIPSGLDESGSECTVRADYTVSLAAYKYCQLFGGRDACGKIIVKDIQIPIDTGSYVYEDSDIKAFFPKRRIESNKGTYGKLTIIAGSGKYYGAALISYNAAAALLAGAGLVTLTVPRFLAPSYRKHITESVLEYLPDDGENAVYNKDVIDKIMVQSDAICVGMGMGNNKNTFRICEEILRNFDKKLLIDADGLNSISAYGKDVLKNKHKCEVIITPHPKEFSRLINSSISAILQNPLAIARRFAEENNIAVLLKGASTIITNGEKDVINVTGTPAMAKAGSGDVLSGIIGGLMAQKHPPFESGIAGAYIHGRAGEKAAEISGEYSVLATDICANIGPVIKQISNQ
jgi:NAD(P)H-hydrate epimerase